MIRIQGVIRPNAPYKAHIHGDVQITEPRKFVVDDKACAVADKPGEVLVLPVAFYESMRHKIGVQLVVEPDECGNEAAAERIADLEAALKVAADDAARFLSERNAAREQLAAVVSERDALKAAAKAAAAPEPAAETKKGGK